jgi:hypothetical protein
MKLSIFLILIFASTVFGEKVDSKCAVDCRAKGYQYHYCEMKCLNGRSPLERERDTSHAPLESEIDSKCMNVCIKEGKPYNKCEVKCRY